MEESNEKLYLYAVTYKTDSQSFDIGEKGIDGGKVYLVSTDTLSAIVTPIQEEELQISRKNALNHQEIIEKAREKFGTVVPVSFGTVVKNKRTLKNKLLFEKEEHLLHTLDRIKGKVQITIKALWPDIEQTIKEVSQRDPLLANLPMQGQEKTVSVDVAVKVGKLVESRLTKEREQIKEQILSYMTEVSEQQKELSRYGDEMICNMVFLLPTAKEKKARQALKTLAKQLEKNKMIVRYSDAMTPYDFVSLQMSLEE